MVSMTELAQMQKYPLDLKVKKKYFANRGMARIPPRTNPRLSVRRN